MMWYSHTMEYNSAREKNKLVIRATMRINLTDIILGKKWHTKSVQCIIPLYEVREHIKSLCRDRDRNSGYLTGEWEVGCRGESGLEVLNEKFTGKGPEGTSEVILFLDLGDCYMDVYICKISSEWTLRMCAFYYV